MKYGNVSLGQVEAIINTVGGTSRLPAFLAGEFSVVRTKFSVWLTVKAGGYVKTSKQYLAAVLDQGFKVGTLADEFLCDPNLTTIEVETEFDLVKVSLYELGFPNGAHHLDEIYARAAGVGLEICPWQIGPKLRLDYDAEQPINDGALIAMTPIRTAGGHMHVFSVNCNHNGERSLSTFGTTHANFLYGGLEFIFVLPRKNSGRK